MNIEADWVDPDDAPEVDAAWFDKADHLRNDVLVKRGRGRPVGSLTSTKRRVTVRIDGDALDRLRAAGPGWQTRINEAVRKAVGL